METLPSSSGQALPAGTRLEEFVIGRVLGSGGFGITYLAGDTRLERRVVIKENLPIEFAYRDTNSLTVHPRSTAGGDAENFGWSLESFAKEAAMLASLRHPGIVPVLRSFEALGTAYFVMPFLEGVEFDQLIESRRSKGQPFTTGELTGFLEHVLDALTYLHERGIYHRDVKPKNVLLTQEGAPVLIDFGAARQRIGERSMTVLESPGYTPFEQHQSRGNIGPWSDLYSLGATLVKAATFETPPKAADRLRNDPFVPLATRQELSLRYPVPLLESIDKAFAVEEEERWQDARAWREALADGDWQSGASRAQAALARRPAPPVAAAGGEHGLGRREEAVAGGAGEAVGRRHAQSVSKAGWRGLMVAGLLCLLMVAGGLIVWQVGRGSRDKTAAETRVAPPPPKSGVLVVTSEPSGATLHNADGVGLGTTPCEVKDLPGGEPWRGRLELKGYLSVAIEAEVVFGETKLVPLVKLEPLPQKVVVTSEPSGVEVLDGTRVLGTTPWEISGTSPGTAVRYVLRKEGFRDLEVGGDVKVGEPLALFGALKLLPQDVVIRSEPGEAEVWDGSRRLGVTPCIVRDVRPGTWVSYVVKKDGFESRSVDGIVQVGVGLELGVELPRKPEPLKSGLWSVVEQVTPGSGGWRIEWLYQFRAVGSAVEVSGSKVKVDGKNPTPGEKLARASGRLESAAAGMQGNMVEINHRGERLESRWELTPARDGKSFTGGRNWAKGVLVSELTGKWLADR